MTGARRHPGVDGPRRTPVTLLVSLPLMLLALAGAFVILLESMFDPLASMRRVVVSAAAAALFASVVAAILRELGR